MPGWAYSTTTDRGHNRDRADRERVHQSRRGGNSLSEERQRPRRLHALDAVEYLPAVHARARSSPSGATTTTTPLKAAVSRQNHR